MSKIFEIVRWEDDSIGQGWTLLHRGEEVGTAGAIWLLRLWARQCWQQRLDDDL